MRHVPLLLLCLAGCAHGGPAPGAARRLDPNLGWRPEVRARLDALMETRGRHGPRYDPAHPPVAVFDWDNTVMKNDIGDATFAWLLAHDKVLAPPGGDWGRTNPHLTPEARAELAFACRAEPGRPLPTSTDAGCADALLSIYEDERTLSGAPAWSEATTPTNHQPYAWMGQLLAGYTPAEVRGFAAAAYQQNAEAAVGATQQVGTHAVAGYVRVYDAMRDLIAALQEEGFAVWIVSASPQDLAEVVAAQVGVPAEHVVGIRLARGSDGRYLPQTEPCGTLGPNEVITYNEGKRCWINKAIFGRPPEEQLLRSADPARRPALAAGDSDTDLAMVQDATDLKLVIDRHRPRLMCNALANAGGRWAVQPMFLEPLERPAQPYPCRTLTDATGAVLLDEDGRPIADQGP